MNDWPIALSTGCFFRRRLTDILEPLRDSGFQHIEVCSFPAHLDYHNPRDVAYAADRLRALSITPVSFHAPFADRIDITSFDHATREAAINELTIACDAAATLGCQYVVLHPGPEREGKPPDHEFVQHMHLAASAINHVARHCATLGVTLLLENMLGHLMFGHVRDLLYLLGEIRSPNIGACLDTGHAHLARELHLVINKLSGHLKLVHINDNHGDWDAHLPPGHGSIQWHAFLAELQASHFHGPLILEIAGHDHETIEQILTRARHAKEYLRHPHPPKH